MAAPPASLSKKRPISAAAMAQTGRQSQEQFLVAKDGGVAGKYVYGGWDGGGVSSVRPASAPASREIKIIDRRRQKPSFRIHHLELDQVVHSVMDAGKRQELMRENGGAKDWGRGEIGGSLGSSAQATVQKNDQFKVLTRSEHSAYLTGGRVGVSASQRECNTEHKRTVGREVFRKAPVVTTPNTHTVFGTPSKSMTAEIFKKQETPKHKDNYHRVLEELSSPSPLRVRVTVKKSLVRGPTPLSPSSLPLSSDCSCPCKGMFTIDVNGTSECVTDMFSFLDSLARLSLLLMCPFSLQLQVVAPTPRSIQQIIDRQKRPGSAPSKRYSPHTEAHTHLNRESGKLTMPWRWRNTQPLPIGHHRRETFLDSSNT